MSDETFQEGSGEEWKGSESGLDLKKLMERGNALFAKWDADKAARKAAGFDFNAFIERTACESWTENGVDFWICRHPILKHRTGCVRFPKQPLKAEGYKAFAAHIPVHGGITWAEDSPDGTYVYGFDCGHSWDRESLPSFDEKDFLKRLKRALKGRDESSLVGKPKRYTFRYLRAQTKLLAAGIVSAARYEDAYLAATTNEEKAAVIDQFHHYMQTEGFGEFNLTENFLAMASVLFGRL